MCQIALCKPNTRPMVAAGALVLGLLSVYKLMALNCASKFIGSYYNIKE